MASTIAEKKAAFMQRIRVSPSQLKSAKQSQFLSNNKSNNKKSSDSDNSNKADAPDRVRGLGGGRGNER